MCWTERAAGALCKCRTPQRPKQLLTKGKRKKKRNADEPVLLEGSWNSSCSCFYHQCSKGKTALFSHGYWLLTSPVKGYLSVRYMMWGFNSQSLGTLFCRQLFLLLLQPLPWGQLHSAALSVLQPPFLLKSELQKMQLGTKKSLFWSSTGEGGDGTAIGHCRRMGKTERGLTIICTERQTKWSYHLSKEENIVSIWFYNSLIPAVSVGHHWGGSRHSFQTKLPHSTLSVKALKIPLNFGRLPFHIWWYVS